MFLRHEGFLGAIGAFMSYEKHGLDDLMAHQLVERFPTCSPYMIEQTCSPSLIDLNEKVYNNLFFIRINAFINVNMLN